MAEKIMKNKTILAIVSIVIGILLIIKKADFLVDVVKWSGILLIVAGVAYVVLYFINKENDQVMLGYAGLAVIAGILLVVFCAKIVYSFPVIVGVLLIVNGIANLVHANGTGSAPAYTKGAAILIILLGILVIIFKYTALNVAVILLGIALILNGLADLNLIGRFWEK